MSCAVQQGPNVRLVPPGDVNNEHAYRQTDRQTDRRLYYTCTVTEQQSLKATEHVTAAGNRHVRREAHHMLNEWFHTNFSTQQVSEVRSHQ